MLLAQNANRLDFSRTSDMSFDSEKRRYAHIIGKKERRAQRVSHNLMCTQILVDSYVCSVHFFAFDKSEGTLSCFMFDDVFDLLYSQHYVATHFGCHVTNKKTIKFVDMGD